MYTRGRLGSFKESRNELFKRNARSFVRESVTCLSSSSSRCLAPVHSRNVCSKLLPKSSCPLTRRISKNTGRETPEWRRKKIENIKCPASFSTFVPLQLRAVFHRDEINVCPFVSPLFTLGSLFLYPFKVSSKDMKLVVHVVVGVLRNSEPQPQP